MIKMFRKIELVRYEVDEAMMGTEWDSEKYSLEEFCEILQKVAEEQCLFFEIIPITDSWNGATHKYDDPEYSLWSREHLGVFPRYEYAWDWIDWELALERYYQKYDENLLGEISDDDLTEIPEKLRMAIITKRDNPEKFTRGMYQNIYHNLIRKNPEDFDKIAKKYTQKSKLSRIFHQIEI